jgi:hypothetical protein
MDPVLLNDSASDSNKLIETNDDNLSLEINYNSQAEEFTIDSKFKLAVMLQGISTVVIMDAVFTDINFFSQEFKTK